ncbi:hypothetical protein [Xanthomonas indica]|uniref:Uncharacterized protein n=1 Tax=Xanthomonas indica TaxID=2912242 RepID=A0AAU8I6F2_9XANT|nr:hypothetical protein [Xanthomonas indica]MCI2261156.1 hypothetical protein [Xanthomonas indica]
MIHNKLGPRKEKAAMHDMTWSASEKKAARALFDTALQRELQAYLQEFKRSAASIDTPDALWPLIDQAVKREREIARTYDYRYSQLILVFAGLLRRGIIQEVEVGALGDEKARHIIALARLKV